VNTNTLAKQYGHLTPWERIPLMLAAEARGDKVEQRRLTDSAPIEAVKMPDYLMPMMALNTMSLMYIAEQLDNLASYWHAVCRPQRRPRGRVRGSYPSRTAKAPE
jgi:hypothetical protein